MERRTNWFVLLLLTTLGTFPAFGTVCTTIADGAFTDDAIWSCGCDPSSCDTLIIENEVSHEGDLVLPIDLIHITISGSLTTTGMLGLYAEILCEGTIAATEIATDVPHPARCSGLMHADIIRIGNADLFWNTGQVTADDSLLAGYFATVRNEGNLVSGHCRVLNRLDNYGSCEFNDGLYSSGFFFSYGSVMGHGAFVFNASIIDVSESTIQADSVSLLGGNSIHGTIIADSLMLVGDTISGANIQLYGGAALICRKDFYNSEYSYIHGGGSICIGRHSENHGTLESVDICDATPTVTEEPILDVNDGTVWNSVDYCQNGFCASIAGVDERPVLEGVQVVPNPAHDRCVIRVPSGTVIASYELFDAQGRMIDRRTMPWTSELELEVSAAGAGVYTIVLHCQGGAKAARSVVFLP